MRQLLCALFCLLALAAWASSADYVFTAEAGTYVPFSDGAQIHGAGVSSDTEAGMDIGFDFIYNGVVYTQFGICTNGYLIMGTDNISTRNNDLTSSYYHPLVCALWDYLKTNTGDGEVTCKVTGAAPNRVLWVQYTNMQWYRNASPLNLVNFQIRLYEGTNNIEIQYGAFGTAPGSSASASIGMNMIQSGSTQFISVTPGSPATVSTTAANNNITGTEAPYITSGLIYRFTYSPLNQSINAITAAQASTDIAQLGSVDQPLLSVNVNTSNSGNPFSVTGMSFVNSGTLNAGTGRLYYTGASATFATTAPLGDSATFSATGDTLTFACAQELLDGNNYFWLAYDVPADYAHLNQTLDATVCSVTIPDDATPVTTPDPEGERVADDTVAPAITYTNLTSPSLIENRTLAGVSITEAVSMSTTPRLYYKKSTNADVFGDNTADSDGWKYAEGVQSEGTWSFELNVALIYGALADGDVLQYFVAAQDDKPETPNVASRPSGFTGTVAAPLTAPATPATYTVIVPLNGNYHVGPGQTWTTLSSFFTYAVSRGISEDATVWLTGDIAETTNATLTQLTEYGAGGYTLTISPMPDSTVTISASLSSNGLITLNGADRVVIDGGENCGLTIMNTYYRGKELQINPGSDNITVRNCTLCGSGTMNSTSYGIYSSGGALCGLLVDNVNIHTTSYGIYLSGLSTTVSEGNTIRNCRIGSDDTAAYLILDGIYATDQNNLLISHNDIGGAITSSWEPKGLELNRITNAEICNNKIHDFTYTGSAGMGAKGIHLFGLTGENPNVSIHDNMIWHFGSDGDIPGYVPAGIRISGSSTGGVSVCYNTICLTRDETYGMGNYDSGTTFCTGIEVDNSSATCPTGLTMKNNIFDIRVGERTGCTLFTYATAVFVRSGGEMVNPFADISNNLYYTTNADSNVVAVYYFSSAYTWYSTLADWAAFTGETNSQYADPLLNELDPMHLMDGSPAIGAGVAITGYTTDFDGDTRNDPPCIGADEVAAAAPDAPVNVMITFAEGVMTITWDAVSGATGYNVYAADDPQQEFSLIGQTTEPQYTATPEQSARYYRITATR